MKIALAITILLLNSSFIAIDGNDWIIHARIATPYGYNTTWKEGVARAVKNGANVILDWADFSDTYGGRILHFNESLQEFKKHAEYIHFYYPGVKYMVYFAPLEMGTPDSDMNKDERWKR